MFYCNMYIPSFVKRGGGFEIKAYVRLNTFCRPHQREFALGVVHPALTLWLDPCIIPHLTANYHYPSELQEIINVLELNHSQEVNMTDNQLPKGVFNCSEEDSLKMTT